MKFASAFLAAFSILALPLTAQDKKPKRDVNKLEGAATLERLNSIDSWQTLFNGIHVEPQAGNDSGGTAS